MKWRRRTYLINKKYQYKYIAVFTGVAILAVLYSAVMIIHEISSQIDAQLQKSVINISRTGEIVLPVVLQVSSFVVATLIIILALMSVYYFRHTHNIALSLSECIKRFRNGELHHNLMISQGADFKKTEEAFNLMLASNNAKIKSLKKYTDEIGRAMQAIELSALGGNKCEVGVHELDQALCKVDKTLSSFKLD